MTSSIINQLASHDVHQYGSVEQLTLEKHMAKYFSREYDHWNKNKSAPEEYGVSSFEGDIAKKETRGNSTDHYNEEYRAYRMFLDKTYMAYTMAFYGATESSQDLEDISLEEAQLNKYNLLIERAGIEDGQSVLDLGCGFGGLSKYLLTRFPRLSVVGINPSDVQVRHIRNELIDKDTDFDDSRFTLIQGFFDDVDESVISDCAFDRVISVGLLEHVTNIDLLQKNISRVLKSGGKCLHHCIVSMDTLPKYLNSEDSYMGHYYPGAHIWPISEPCRHNAHLEFSTSWFINGMNYWKTLDDWHMRFWESIEQLCPAYLSIEEVENWNRYFSLCKAMFIPNRGTSYGNGQFLYIKN